MAGFGFGAGSEPRVEKAGSERARGRWPMTIKSFLRLNSLGPQQRTSEIPLNKANMKTFKDLFFDELKDRYSAEQNITKPFSN